MKKTHKSIPATPVFLAANKYFFHITVFLIASFLLSCGKDRKIDPDETGIPTTLPREQILYREARSTFVQWIGIFTGNSAPGKAFDLLTKKSRQKLSFQGISTMQDFNDWFLKNKQQGLPPFSYEFSRTDILDIDIRDTNKAIITATFLVDFQTRQIESVGSFFLVREKASWRIPFGESGDWERSWWQQESNFGTRISDEGFTTLFVAKLGIELVYPVTWDVSEFRPLKLPGETIAHPGIELSYLNPISLQKEAFIRICSLPPASFPTLLQNRDTTETGLVFLKKEDASILDEFQSSGKSFLLYNANKKTVLVVYGGVNESVSDFSNYNAIITKIVESLSIPS